MKRPSRLDYAYAVGRVRALERELVERDVFSEAAEERDVNSALKIIFDAGKFSEETIEVNNSGELDDFLEKEEKLLVHLLEELLLEKVVLQLLLALDEPEKALGMSRQMNYPFIEEYIKHAIDLANLKIIFRLKYLGAPRERFERLRLKGGFLEDKKFLESYDFEYAEIGEVLQFSPYKKVWDEAVDARKHAETFVALEREIEDFMMIYLKKAKYVVFGPEPVFAYALAKKKELDLVRLVGVGKLNDIPLEFLRKRISDTYV